MAEGSPSQPFDSLPGGDHHSMQPCRQKKRLDRNVSTLQRMWGATVGLSNHTRFALAMSLNPSTPCRGSGRSARVPECLSNRYAEQ